jgi:hypothetical protein
MDVLGSMQTCLLYLALLAMLIFALAVTEFSSLNRDCIDLL